MTEDMESALLGHVLDLKGDMEHVRGVAERTLEQARLTNGRVSQLEDWRRAHDVRIKAANAHASGAREAHAEHAERHRRRRALVTGAFSVVLDRWELAVMLLTGTGIGFLGEWLW